jgi:hypothetical protein
MFGPSLFCGKQIERQQIGTNVQLDFSIQKSQILERRPSPKAAKQGEKQIGRRQ